MKALTNKDLEHIEVLKTIISDVFAIEMSELLSKKRNRPIARARQALMFLMRTELRLSFSEIGRKLSRDHTTVLTACHEVLRLTKDPTDLYRAQVLLARGRLLKEMEAQNDVVEAVDPA